MIDEKKLIEEIEEYIEEYRGIDENGHHNLKWCAMMEALETIKNQPKVGEWIPADNPPINGQEVLVTTSDGYVAMCKYEEGEYLIANGYVYTDMVEAWQPKPEPWKGKSDE